MIEDEIPAAHHLASMIKKYDGNILPEGPLDSNAAIVEWFRHNQQPDLIFSDIELLDGPVFQAFSQCLISAPIIFTTAYDQYTLEAFETNGISYLLKPFDLKQLSKAMDKFQLLKKGFSNTDNSQLIEKLKQLHLNTGQTYKTRLNIRIGNGIYLLQVTYISCIRMHNSLPHAFKKDGKKYPLSPLLAELEASLDPNTFFRINRSEMVNVNFIEKVEPYFNDRLAVSISGQKEVLITSAGRTPDFRKWLSEG
jgi:DNA-binding LytR/AlgR family response regulator